MIDGVDVSGCECFYINASHPKRLECINPFCKDFCKDNPNCYYKQLKRKEQECEELTSKCSQLKEENKELHSLIDLIKTDLMKSDMENDDLIVQNDKLEEENEKLEKEIKDLEDLAKFKTKAIRELQQQIDTKEQRHTKKINVASEIQRKLHKARQVLSDIKDITEHCIKQDICTICDNSDKCYIEDEEIPTYDVCKLILQKIKEVINEN